MIGRLRQLSEPRLRKQAGIEKSLTPVERDILVQWVRNAYISSMERVISINKMYQTTRIICLDMSKKSLSTSEVSFRVTLHTITG